MKSATNITLCVAAILVMLLAGSQETTAVTCMVTELAACATAFSSPSPPSQQCCRKLKEQRPCLCQYMKNPSLRSYVASPKAKTIAISCAVPTPQLNRLRYHNKSTSSDIMFTTRTRVDYLKLVYQLVLSSFVLMAPKPEFGSTSDNPKVTTDNPIAALHAHMLHIAQLSTDTNAKLDQLIDLMTNQRVNQPPPPPTPPPPPPPHHNNQNIRPPKIHLPNFDGANPLDWHMSNNHLLGTWAEFTCALETRFGPSTYENHQATLFKLHQISTVAAYQSEFEKISNCVVGLPPHALRDCFISGLRLDIHAELALHGPQTLQQTYGLNFRLLMIPSNLPQ
ncbi:hypothetical protein LXL04_020165 [Taraxacum kok-saghyz]